MLHLVKLQAYKLELSKRQRLYDIFYILLLEQNTTTKRYIDETIIELEFDDSNDKDKSDKQEMKKICDGTVYDRKLEGYLPGYYYLVLIKNYPK